MDALLAELAAKQAITEVLYRYARGWDRYDRETLQSCYHPGAIQSHGGFEGTAAEFIDFGLDVTAKVHVQSHMMTNPLIAVAGDQAVSECSYLAFHRRDRADGAGQEDMFIKGRFVDRFALRDGEWRIVHRHALYDFERVLPPADVSLAGTPAQYLGTRRPADPLYALLEGLGG